MDPEVLDIVHVAIKNISQCTHCDSCARVARVLIQYLETQEKENEWKPKSSPA